MIDEIKFDSDQNEFAHLRRDTKPEFDLVGKLIKWGVVSNQQQALYVLAGFICVALVVVLWLWIASRTPPVELPVEAFI